MNSIQNLLNCASSAGITDIPSLFADIGKAIAKSKDSSSHSMAAFRVFCRHVYVSTCSPDDE